MERREEIMKYLSNPLILLALFVQLVMIVLLIITVTTFNSGKSNDETFINKGENTSGPSANSSKVSVSELETLNLPSNSIDNIRSALYSIIARNNTMVKDTNLNAKIRDKKEVFFKDQQLHYISFIIDLKDYKQSYQVVHEWSEKENNTYLAPNDSVIAYCVDEKAKRKYDFQCVDDLTVEAKYQIINHYVEYAEFDDFNAYGLNPQVKIIGVNMTNTNKSEDQVVAEIEEWIKTMGFSPEGFEYNFDYGESFEEE